MTVVATSPAATLQAENLHGFATDAWLLLQKHWTKVSGLPELPLNPDLVRYGELEAAGQLRIYTARVGAELVAYAVFVLGNSLHSMQALQATEDLFYVEPTERRGYHAVRLLRFIDNELKREGVLYVFQHVKPNSAAHAAMLDHEGYEIIENVWVKRLCR